MTKQNQPIISYNDGRYTLGTWRVDQRFVGWAAYDASGNLLTSSNQLGGTPASDKLAEWQTLIEGVVAQWAGREGQLHDYMVSQCYIRFGRLPRGNRSRNHATGQLESGVSCYCAQFDPINEVWAFADDAVDPAAMLLGTAGIYDNAMLLKGHKIARGSDNEPILAPDSVAVISELEITSYGYKAK